MHLIKKIWGLDALRLCVSAMTQAILMVACLAGEAFATSCLPPPRPFVPSDSEVARDYADLIRSDFELYIQDIQDVSVSVQFVDPERVAGVKVCRILEYLDIYSFMAVPTPIIAIQYTSSNFGRLDRSLTF